MSQKPLVSVIIIFLDAEPFIREAIDAVCAQSYDAWELLLCDDGSTDGSTAVARYYAQQYPEKVRYLEHPGHQNHGMSVSRNLGLAHARGDYIAFLDADDVWLPHKLAQQVATLESQPQAVMVYGPTQWWYSWTGRPEDRQRDYILDPGLPANTLLQPPQLLTRFLRQENTSPCTCSVLIRRQAVAQVGGFEENFRGLYEDQAFFAKISLMGPVIITRDCLARYRQHTNSNCSITQRTGEYETARLTFLNWLEAYLTEQGVQNSEVWHALRAQFLPYRHPFLFRLFQRARHGLPGRAYRFLPRLRAYGLTLPLIRQLRCLQFRRLQPVGHGRQQGTPIVRHYWENYLQQNQADIQGACLEVGTTATIRQWGQALTRTDAIDLTPHSPEITVVADLSRADAVPSAAYDCFINQFTMHLIYDVEAALYHAIRLLKPGGTLLINFPCVDYYFPTGLDMGTGAPLFLYHWFTPIQVENLLRRNGLTGADFKLDVYGNLFARLAYQLNIPAEELARRELAYEDHGHPLLICARIVKPADWQAVKPLYREPWQPGCTPARWNPETGHYAVA